MRTLLIILLLTITAFSQSMRWGNGRTSDGREWSGLYIQGVAGDTLDWEEIVYLDADDNKFHQADADVDSTQLSYYGFVLDSVPAGDQGMFLYQGFISDTSWDYTSKDSVYLSSTTGEYTTSGTIRLGYVQSAEKIFFDANEFRGGGAGDTTHYVEFNKVIGLQDSLDAITTISDSFYTEDARIPVSAVRLLGSNDPASTLYLGGEVLAFSNLADNKVFFEFQLPHARQADSDIAIHLHFALEDNGTNPDSVRWVLTYTWQNINGQFSAPTTVNYTDYVSDQVDSTHYYESIATISGTGKTASSMLLCSLTRDVSEDDYGGDVYLMEIDAHYSARDIVGAGSVLFDTTSIYQAINAIGDSNFVLTSETTNWDKTTTDDVEWGDTTATIATQNDLILGYQPLDADLTDLSDGSLTFSKVAGLQDSMNVANAYVDSNYVLTSETSGWDKTSWKFPKGYIWGLTLSNNGSDAANDIDIAVGQACDGDAEGDMILAGALTKRLDAGWAVGTNQGGLNTGAEANSTWYEVHLIKRTDTGVVDVMFTTTANRSTLPASYTLSRRIGWIYNDGSGNIRAFSQRGNYFTWVTQVNDVNATMTESATAATLSAPPYTIARFRAAAVSTTSVNETAVIVFSEIVEGNVTPASTTAIASLGVEDMASVDAAHFELRVDASSQIEWDTDNTVATFDISTYGYIDERCQYGDY